MTAEKRIKLPHAKSVQRVATQNLVVSAIQAECKPKGAPLSMAAVRDLSTLINLAVLYDEVFLLGRGDFRDLGSPSDLLGLLYQKEMLRSEELNESMIESITSTARKHLLYFLKTNEEIEFADFSDILNYSLSPDALYAHVYQPDNAEQVRLGETWFRSAPEGVDLVAALRREQEFGRNATFFARTFLYLGYADYSSLPLLVDSARTTAVRKVLRNENNAFRNSFRNRTINVLQDAFEKYPKQHSDVSRKLASPFSAVVFDRCNGDRSRIAAEVEKLREELTDLRRTLATLEWDALWTDREEAIEIEQKFEMTLAELARSYGPSPGLLSLEKGISFVNDAIEVAEDPTSWKAWSKAVGALPVEVVKRMLARRPVAEIHELKTDIPGPLALRKTIEDLFGPVIDEGNAV